MQPYITQTTQLVRAIYDELEKNPPSAMEQTSYLGVI
jgi:hypothetical protein